jgi:rod shape-determining protein MreD
MRPVAAFLVSLALASVQAAILRFAGGGGLSLALALPVVVYLGLFAGNVDGAVGAAGVGYVIDLMSGGPKGLMTFLAVALFLFSRLIGAALAVQGRIGFAVLTGIGTFLYGAVALLFLGAVSPAESAPGFGLTGRLLAESLATAALSPLVFEVMRRVDGLFVREESGLLR